MLILDAEICFDTPLINPDALPHDLNTDIVIKKFSLNLKLFLTKQNFYGNIRSGNKKTKEEKMLNYFIILGNVGQYFCLEENFYDKNK